MQTKTKLTVTIDSDLLPRAKKHAQAHGLSLSSIIEQALREALEEGATEKESGLGEHDWEAEEKLLAEIAARLDEETPEEARARREDKTLPFVARWLGQFKPDQPLTDKELDDMRYEHLVQKHG